MTNPKSDSKRTPVRKKRALKVELDEIVLRLEEVTQAPIPMEDTQPKIVIRPMCLRCHFMNNSTWRGPYCTNKLSPDYKRRVADDHSCDQFVLKASV